MRFKNLICAITFFFFTGWLSAQKVQWQCLGPDSLPAIGGDSSYFLGFTQGIGRTSCIRFHPLYNGTTNNTVFIGTPHGGLWRSYNGKDHWQEMNTSGLPNIGISDIIFHPDDTSHLYIATGDPDAGLDANQPSFGTEDTQSRGIYESTDAGKTWSGRALGTWCDQKNQALPDYWTFPTWKVMRRILINSSHPEVMIAIVYKYDANERKYQSFIYRSNDGGKNWLVAFTYIGDNFQDIESVPGNPDVIYVSGRNIFKSTDAGATWQKITSANFPADSTVARCKLITFSTDSTILYALFMVGRSAKLYFSKDEGVTFAFAVQGLGSPPWRTSMAVDPNNKYSVYYTSGNFVSHFYYNGTRWYNEGANENTHSDIHELAFTPGGGKLYVSTDGGLYVADNAGAAPAWKYINGIGNAAVWRIGISPQNPDLIIAGLQDCGTLLFNSRESGMGSKSANSPNSAKWSIIRGGDGAACFIDYASDSVMYHTDGQNNVFARSDDGGRTWININPPGQSGDYVKPALLDPVDHNTIYTGFNEVFKSSDRGKTWKAISDLSSIGKAKNERVCCIAVAPSNHKTIYAAVSQPTWSDKSNGKIFRTTDGGTAWQDITPGLTGVNYSSITALAVDPNDEEAVYVGFRGGWDFKVMRSLSGGVDSSWQNYSEDLPKEADVNAIVIDQRKKGGIYIGTHHGVYERKKSYGGWIPFMDFNESAKSNDGSSIPFPNARVTDLKINYTSSELIAATLGRGVWKTVLPSKKTKKKKK